MIEIKIIIEKHVDGYIGYPLGLKGVIVGQGDNYDEALVDVKSAIAFHIETFGRDIERLFPLDLWRFTHTCSTTPC